MAKRRKTDAAWVMTSDKNKTGIRQEQAKVGQEQAKVSQEQAKK
jgi:hypothetical protein